MLCIEEACQRPPYLFYPIVFIQRNFIAKVQVGVKTHSSETGKINPTITQARKHRNIRARKDLQDWLKRVGLPYHSPHKFRHGNAVYSLKNAKDVSALKAVSQNLMHANLSVTDGTYGILSQIDIKEQIAFLGKPVDKSKSHSLEELLRIAKLLIERLE